MFQLLANTTVSSLQSYSSSDGKHRFSFLSGKLYKYKTTGSINFGNGTIKVNFKI